jgi:hypothetical protein
MSDIFVSYRRADSAGWTGRLVETLKEQFGEDAVFKDIDTIQPGVDFVDAIRAAVGSCKVLLAVIGPDWLTALGEVGRDRRHGADYVRTEISAALDRKVRVIPVLVGGAGMPRQDDLPTDLEALARRNAIEVSDTRWDYDSERLVAALERALGRAALRPSPPKPVSPNPGSEKEMSGKAIGSLVVLVVGFLVASGPGVVDVILGLMTTFGGLALALGAIMDVSSGRVRGKGLAITMAGIYGAMALWTVVAVVARLSGAVPGS